MSEWTPEAREYLGGYLGQVSALARSQGDDADDIVGELRAHIECEAEDAAGVLVTIEHLRTLLAKIGTPEQIAGAESALGGWDGDEVSLRETVASLNRQKQESWNTPAESDEAPQDGPVPVPALRCSTRVRWSYLLALAGSLFLVLLGAWTLWVLTQPQYSYETVNPVLLDQVRLRQEPSEKALATLGAIAKAQEAFKEAGIVDLNADGVGDYATIQELADPSETGTEGYHPFIDPEMKSTTGVKDQYEFTIQVTYGDGEQEPGYECRAAPNQGPWGRRYFLDETGVIRYSDDGHPAHAYSTPFEDSLFVKKAEDRDDGVIQYPEPDDTSPWVSPAPSTPEDDPKSLRSQVSENEAGQ